MSFNEVWSATCPKCEMNITMDMLKCRNCGKGNIKASSLKETYLGCDNCDESFGYLNCPSCGASVSEKFFIRMKGPKKLLKSIIEVINSKENAPKRRLLIAFLIWLVAVRGLAWVSDGLSAHHILVSYIDHLKTLVSILLIAGIPVFAIGFIITSLM